MTSRQPSAVSRQQAACIIAGLIAASLLVTTMGFAAGPAPAKKKIMLGAIAAPSIPAEQVRSLENLVCAELAQNRVFDVVCPDDVGAVLKEQQLKMGLGACMDGDCMNVAGKLMESDYTVAGAVDAAGGKYVFTLTVVEGAGGLAVAKASVESAADVEKLTAKLKTVVSDLYKSLAAPPPPAAKTAPDKPAAKDPAAGEKKEEKKEGKK